VARYIHMNPVKAGLVDRPEGYRWSSYGAYIGKDRAWLVDAGFLLGSYAGTRKERVEAFRRETVKGEGEGYSPDKGLRGGVIAGSEKFWEWLKRVTIPRRREERVSRWRELQEPGDDIGEALMRRVGKLTDDEKMRRKLLAYALKNGTGMRLQEIAKVVGMRSAHAVNKAVRRLGERRSDDAVLDRAMLKLDSQIRSGQ